MVCRTWFELVCAQEQPTNASIWEGIGEVYEKIGDDSKAASQFSSQGQALLQRGEFVGAAVAFEKAVELRPQACEYSYWLADAMHSALEMDGSKTGKKKAKKKKHKAKQGRGGGFTLVGACEMLESAVDCVSGYRDDHEGGPYLAQLEGDEKPATAITEGNFIPTLLEWYGEGVHAIAAQSDAAAGQELVGAIAADMYAGSARALARLDPDEASSAGMAPKDVQATVGNYMLQASVGYSAARRPEDALAALAAVPTGGECPVPAQFVTAGLTVLAEAAQGEGATRSELVALVLGRAAAARRCGLDDGVEQRLSLLQG